MMPSNKVDEYIRTDVHELLWAGHPSFEADAKGTEQACAPPFLKKEAAVAPWGEGGLGVLDWKVHSSAFRAQWFLVC